MSGPTQHPASNSESRKKAARLEAIAITLCNADDTWEHHDATDGHPCSGCRDKARTVRDILTTGSAS